MLIKSVSALAVLAVATVSASEPMPYKPLMKMSVHQMFGVHRRQAGGGDGYQPTQSVCGTGATCAEACGAGYETCASTDQTVHCYNPAAKQTCCPDNSGNSCDDGYYCTSDSAGGTFCCPDGMDLVTCAAQYSVTGSLVSETPKPTTSSTSSSTYSSAATTASSITYSPSNSTTTATYTQTSTSCTSTIAGSVTYPASNATTTTKKPSVVPTSSPSSVSISGASTYGAAGALSLLAAAAVAALL